MKKKIAREMSKRPIRAAPTPMPACAPVERPLLTAGADVEAGAEAVRLAWPVRWMLQREHWGSVVEGVRGRVKCSAEQGRGC